MAMSIDTRDQAQDYSSILVLSTEDSECKQQVLSTIPTDLEVEDSRMSVDAQGNCQNSSELALEAATTYSQCAVDVDIEKGPHDMSKIDEDTGGSMRSEMALTKALRRQNSLQHGGESSSPPIVNHILMLLRLDEKEKPAAEKAHGTTNSRWRKYKRGASFDSRQIALIFSILSSMGTLALIYLTLRVAGDGLVRL